MPNPAPDSDVTELAKRLSANIGSLITEVADRISSQVEVYASGDLVDRQDLDESLRDNIEFLISQLEGGKPLDLAAPRRTGRRRAEQGVPLAAVLSAYRIGFDLVWHTAVAESRESALVTDRDLLDIGSRLWRMLGVYTTEMINSYRDGQTEQLLRDDQQRSALVGAILEGRVADTATIWEAADLLSLPYEGTFAVVAAESPSLGKLPLPNIETRLSVRGIGSAWRLHAEFQVGVVTLRSAEAVTMLVDVLRAAATSRVGVSPVFSTLDGTSKALHLARIALASATAGKPSVTVFDQAPLPLLVTSSPTTSYRVARMVLGPILDLPAGECELLLETLETYFSVQGSAAEAGNRLYLHPNTVRRRLHRMEQLTGRSLDDPEASAELLVALKAYRRLPASRDTLTEE
ncbi:PucR family transcriptional regulator [Amycolatopsis sp. cg13]|uniref:PucR family transcriptional regulator n=1 Tax=Amycolatopsis sp. cg13 TaxID=3238807 RepID=UPI0035243E29